MASFVAGATKIDSRGKVYPLGPKPSADDLLVTTEDVQDASKLALILGKVLDSVSTLRARWYPRKIDFEDLVCDGSGAALTLQHNFGGRVRQWVVDWTSGSAASPILIRGVETDANKLVLYSYQAGTATIRVEEAG